MMTSKELQEGILDVKIPRGSENRKLWKPWRRQWIGFSVVYPSGRREPYLTLELSSSSKEIPGNPIRISRDGLRLFRCRSKSRPYRTWAIMSGNKPLLFFAAETEVRAQEWMQSIREGLWPPCFSFRMLTACSHEVSLIDDDNTFRSGLLGVYGRMVLMSEDLLSLMHPHWGATLLQIPLGSIQDVRLIRYAEIPPAGVFIIELYEEHNSKARTITFYSSTAADAVQWILSKVFTKAAEEDSKFSRNTTSTTIYNQNSGDVNHPVVNPPYSIDKNYSSLLIDITGTESEYEIPLPVNKTSVRNGDLLQKCSSFISTINDQDCTKVASNPTLIDIIDTESEYDIPQPINKTSVRNEDLLQECSSFISTINDRTTVASKQTLLTRSKEVLSEDVIDKQFSDSDISNIYISNDTFLEENSYGNVTSTTISDVDEIQDPFHRFNNNEYANMNYLNENYGCKTDVSLLNSHNNTFESTEYATVNKRHNSKDAEKTEWTDKYQHTKTVTNNVSGDENNFKSKNQTSLDIPSLNTNHLSSFEYGKTDLSTLNFICGKITNLPVSDDDTGKDRISKQSSNIGSDLKIGNPSLFIPDTWDFEKYGKLNEKHVSASSRKESSSFNTFEINHSYNLPNIPSDLLDTSVNSKMLKSKNERLLIEKDSEFLTPFVNDALDDLEFVNNIYEHLLERKGTVYEEIDESDDEFDLHLPPELPKRPSKLEIPDSLRLQKLSESINTTLKVMKTPPSQSAHYSKPNFVKKIKEMGRIMHVGPSTKIITDELSFMKTLQLNNTNAGILQPKKAEIQK